MTFLVTHWIFSMKYWSIACRLELITKGENPDKLKQRFSVLNVNGIVLNILAAVGESFIGNPEKPVMEKIIFIVQGVSVLAPIVSCCFLADAFTRFKKVREED